MIRKLILIFLLALPMSACDLLDNVDDLSDQLDGIRISSISPASGLPGTDVTVKGSGFGAAAPETDGVLFEAVAAAVVSWTDTEIHFTVPDIEPGIYIVTIDGGELSISTQFEVLDADADNDGLSDVQEGELGTDPQDADSDNDGLVDGREVNESGTDPLDADSDDDGLTDGEEVNLTDTDPNSSTSPGLTADSDGDGLTNQEEIDLGTSLTRDDSDGDGLSDGEEVQDHGSDPLDADSDMDGLTDGIEVNEYGFDPTSDADPGLGDDRDGDNLSNYDEYYLHNSDPMDDDTDDDGLDDGEEVDQGTLPYDPDSDDDGLNDYVEVEDPLNNSGAIPLDPMDADVPGPNADYDRDGLTGREEAGVSTDPADLDSDDDLAPDGMEVLLAQSDPNDALDAPQANPNFGFFPGHCWTDEYAGMITTDEGWNYDFMVFGAPEDVCDQDINQSDAVDTAFNPSDGQADLWSYAAESDAYGNSDQPILLSGFSDDEFVPTPYVMTTQPVRIHRRSYVSRANSYVRVYDRLENLTNEEITFTYGYRTNLGSDGGEDQWATSSGDTVADAGDEWVLSDDTVNPDSASGDPAVGIRFGDLTADVIATEDDQCQSSGDTYQGVTLAPETAVDNTGADDDMVVCYQVTIPAGGSIAFLNYMQVDDTFNNQLARMEELGDFTGDALAGLSFADRSLVVNRTMP